MNPDHHWMRAGIQVTDRCRHLGKQPSIGQNHTALSKPLQQIVQVGVKRVCFKTVSEINVIETGSCGCCNYFIKVNICQRIYFAIHRYTIANTQTDWEDEISTEPLPRLSCQLVPHLQDNKLDRKGSVARVFAGVGGSAADAIWANARIPANSANESIFLFFIM